MFSHPSSGAAAAGFIMDFASAVAGLGSANGSRIRCAAHWLAGSGDPRAGSALIAALENVNSVARYDVICALTWLEDNSAVEPLITCLKDSDAQVRQAAIKALVGLQDQRAVEPLIEALSHEDEWTVRAAIGALGRLRDPRAINALVSHISKAQLLNDPHTARWSISREAMSTAMGALGEIGDARGCPALMDCLRDDELTSIERSLAARTLGKIGDKSIIPELITLLKEGTENTREVAAEALGLIRDEHAVVPLIEATKSDEWIVKKTALEALRRIGDRRAILTLLAAGRLEAYEQANLAANAIANLPEDPVSFLIQVIGSNLEPDPPSFLQRLLGRKPAGIAGLSENRRYEILNALGCLAYFPDDRAQATLHKASESTDDDIRSCGIGRLSYWHTVNDHESVEELLSRLADLAVDESYGLSRIDTLLVLESLTVEGLLSGLGSENRYVRGCCASQFLRRYAHGCNKDERAMVFEPLVAALGDTDSNVRGVVAEVLGRIGDPRAIQPLLFAFQALQDGKHTHERKKIGLALVDCGFPDESLVLPPTVFNHLPGNESCSECWRFVRDCPRRHTCGGLVHTVITDSRATFYWCDRCNIRSLDRPT